MKNLRTVLLLDAAASGGLGLLLLALATVLEGPLGLPVTLSLVVGGGLVGWAALVAWVAATRQPALVLDVIVLNVGWVVASVVLAAGAWVELTPLGAAFVLAQAAAVAVLTGLQLRARGGAPQQALA